MSTSRTLVIFYSFEGNTRYVAQCLAEALSADLLELRTREEPRTKGFLKFVWGGGQVVMGRRPRLEPYDFDIAAYDTILIGTPVWAFTFAPPLRTLFATAPLAGKRVAVFCTDEGGIGKTLVNMRRALPESTIIGEREFLSPLTRRDAVAAEARAWAAELAGIA
jgi:flavodoxin